MKNHFFLQMRKNGIAYKKRQRSFCSDLLSIPPLYSLGESLAFKFWAIAEYYSATDIIIDELPPTNEMESFLNTFKAAGITSFVLIENAEKEKETLLPYGCIDYGICKVFRRESILYNGKTEIVNGTRMLI